MYAYFMAYIHFNNNPRKKSTGDCTVRAVSIITGKSWDEAYDALCAQGYDMAEMPSTNSVWGQYLKEVGYDRKAIPNTCPDCYTIKDFCEEHPKGVYVVATGTHVVAVVYGNYIDAWDSGNEVPVYYFTKEE